MKLGERKLGSRAKVALAIKAFDYETIHLGILHLKSDVEMLLHLEWHNKLRNVTPTDDYYSVSLNVNQSRLLQVAARCRQIYEKNKAGQIPYGFSEPNDCFDTSTGDYLFGPTRHGLTCSSFVIAVFRSVGLSLVQSKTWPASRPGDSEYQATLVERLNDRKFGETGEDHIEFVRNQIGAVRYRPEDVAAAGTCKVLPATFAFASGKGVLIAAFVREALNPTP